MSCENKKMWRETAGDFLKNHLDKIPAWLTIFFDKNAKVKEQRCGSYKSVYIFENNVAISLQSRNKDKKKAAEERAKEIRIKNRLDKIPTEYQKHFNYYEEVFRIKTFIFRKLKLCPGDDLFDLLTDKKKKKSLTEQHLKDLILAIEQAHNVGIVIGDLKPGNIMMCGDDSLSFIDLDDAVIIPYKSGTRVIRSPFWSILGYVKNENITQEQVIASDWVAISLIVLTYYHENEVAESMFRDNKFGRQYAEDRNYEFIKTRIVQPKSDLDKAALDIVKGYTYPWLPTPLKLPDQTLINELLRIARTKNKTLFQRMWDKLKF